MKILMVLDHDFPHDHRVEKEIESLIEDKHEIILACFNQKTQKPLFEDHGTYKIYRKNISKFWFKSSVAILKFPFYFHFWQKFIFEILKHEPIDAIHIHDLPLVKVGVKVKNRTNVPLIVDLHENWPASLETAIHTNTFLGKLLSSNRQWRRYEKSILKHADAIITVVDEMKERISKLGIKSDKIHIVSNTINPEFFPLHEATPDPKYITLFYAGGINVHRGLQIVIQAIPLILKEKINIRLNILGIGSYQAQLEQLASELNIKECVHFLGWKNLDEISSYLAQADIALIPHLKSEQTDCSSPNKLYQYMYTEKPVLSSNCNSLERIIRETKCGLTYIHNDPSDFAEKTIELLNNSAKLEYGKNGKKAVVEKYNWNTDSKSLLKLYSNIS